MISVTIRNKGVRLIGCRMGVIGGTLLLSSSLSLPCAEAADMSVASSGRQAADPAHKHKTHKPAKAGHQAHSVTSHTAEHMKVSYSRRSRNGGGGMIRLETAPHSVQTVTRQYIAMRSPTSTPLDLVQMLPSMNVSTADTSGMQGGNITVRGLTDADMGLMLNGGPTTNVHYLNEETDPENIENVSVTPGSSTIDIPTTSAAAGVMNVTQLTPSRKRGGMVDFSYGTNNLSRQFIRLESGEIGQTGIRSFLSFSHAHARSWMGKGLNDRRHVDFGLRKDWDNGSNLSIHTSWNNEYLTIDNFPNEAQFFHTRRTGEGWGHSADYVKSPNGKNNYWKANGNKWNQVFFTAPLHTVLSDRVSFDLTPYISFGQGWTANGMSSSLAGDHNGLYYSDGNPVASGTQLASYYQMDQNRVVGAVGKFNIKLDRHNRLTVGYWYENNLSQYKLPVNVPNADGKQPSPNRFSNQTFIRLPNGQLTRNIGTNYDSGFETHGLFVQDSARYFHNRLTIIGGMKFVMNNLWDNTTSTAPTTGITHGHLGSNPTAPLPQLSIGYQIDKNNQIYINAEGDYRLPSPSNLVSVNNQLPKNQYSIKEELGYRYNNRYFMLDASFFNYNITNRLMTTYITPTLSGVINAGNQTSRGFDFLIAGHPFHHFSPYASIEYLHATIDTNIAYAGSYLPTKGIQAPMAPHVMANFGLSYDDSHFFGNFGLHYAGPQSVTMAGDQRIPGYITNNLSIGYHFPTFSYAKNPTFRLNFTNLTSALVRSGANGLAINKNSITLLNGSQAKSSQGALFYVVPRFTVTGTLSTNF